MHSYSKVVHIARKNSLFFSARISYDKENMQKDSFTYIMQLKLLYIFKQD